MSNGLDIESYAFQKLKKTSIDESLAVLFFFNAMAILSTSNILSRVLFSFVKLLCAFINSTPFVFFSKLCRIVHSKNFVIAGTIVIGLILLILEHSLFSLLISISFPIIRYFGISHFSIHFKNHVFSFIIRGLFGLCFSITTGILSMLTASLFEIR